jgi:hypothetical protein
MDAGVIRASGEGGAPSKAAGTAVLALTAVAVLVGIGLLISVVLPFRYLDRS